MRRTERDLDIKRKIKIKFVWRKQCELTGDWVFLENMYVVEGARFFSRDLFASKAAVYDYCFTNPMTPHQIIEKNLRRQINKQRAMVEKACEGLKAVTAVVAADEWNPATEGLSAKVVVAAENALRELENVW